MRILKIGVLFGLLVSVCALCPHKVLAASTGGLQLSLEPAIFDLGGAPGSSSSTKVRIKNVTKQPELVQVATQAFKPLGKVDDSLLGTTFNAAAWLQASETIFTLDPGQTKVITITAIIPPNAEPGGHYATVSFTLLSRATSDPGPHAYVNTRVSGFAFLTVKGPLDHKLSFSEPSFDSDAGPKLIVPIKNSGTIHELVTPIVTVKDIFGNKVAQWNGTPALILPTESRTLSLPWKVMLPGWYKVQVAATYSPRHLKAQSNLVTVMVAPPVWLIVLSIAVPMIGIVIWLGRRRWRKAWRTLWKS